MRNLFLMPLRPPGACAERKFSSLCIRCGKCLEVCPYNSIRLMGGFGRNRLTPFVDTDHAPCYLCLKCNPVCPSGALDPALNDLHKVKMGQAYILKDKCHNFTDGIMCMTCYDRCPIRSRGIILEFGITPAITKECAGCGVCQYVCPQNAIMIVPASHDLVPANAMPLGSCP